MCYFFNINIKLVNNDDSYNNPDSCDKRQQ